jgi:Protein of unknown function (DUF3563)
MKPKILWDERMGMLMACGSPGSALAYHLGQTGSEPMMVHRSTASERSADQPTQGSGTSAATSADAETDTAGVPPMKGWLARAWLRFETWSWQRQLREREAYLAQAKDLAELEARMRDLDDDAFLSRARALR